MNKLLTENKFDLTIIGAGSAGFSAAIKASERGAKVAIIGHGTIGGTCVNVGCVPSKTLIRAAQSLHQAVAPSRFSGIACQGTVTSWEALVAQKDSLVSHLRQAKYSDILQSNDSLTYIQGKARLSHGGVLVDGQHIHADKVIIATGSSPSLPQIPGIKDVPVLTSTTAFALKSLPASMLVIGAGYIGCELAQMFSRLGVKITLLCRSRLLPEAEPEISTALAEYLRDEGITLLDAVSYQEIKPSSKGVALSFTKDNIQCVVEAAKVIVATGRTPNTKDLDLSENGITLSPNGGIQVDHHLCTSNPNIYAAGDVTGRDLFVYMAAYGAKIAAHNALSQDNHKETYNSSIMPSVVFTDPQVASVGLTEAAAKKQGMNIMTSILHLSHVPRYITAHDIRGLFKLVAEIGSGKLIGAHILAPEASEIIQTAALAIKAGMTVEELGEIIFPYLTGSEGLKLAAQAFNKDVAMLSCCA